MCVFKDDVLLAKFGIHVLNQKGGMEDIQFTNPCKKRKLLDDNAMSMITTHNHHDAAI